MAAAMAAAAAAVAAARPSQAKKVGASEETTRKIDFFLSLFYVERCAQIENVMQPAPM